MTGVGETRRITDADANAIAEALQKRVTQQFYADLGRGLWAWIWRGALAGMIAFAAYSGLKGWK
jgi:hypothetical protein